MDCKNLSDLIRKYQNGTCSAEERELLDYWYQFLDREEIEDGKIEEIRKEEIWEQIVHNTDVDLSEKKVIRNRRVSFWLKIAASFILLCVVGVVVLNNKAKSSREELFITESNDLIETSNYTDQRMIVVLKDGSRVSLAPGSAIKYAEPFEERTILLSGNAFFDISKDSLRPFTVYAGELVTRVLGTSFFIRTDVGKKYSGSGDLKTEVEVVTGKVEVTKMPDTSNDNPRKRIILSPNQKATYFTNEKELVKGIANEPVLIKPMEVIQRSNWFHFTDTPLVEVLNRLKEAYQVDIQIMDEAVQTCPFTADLTDQGLFIKLDIICAALKTTYRKEGTRIIIEGGNCN